MLLELHTRPGVHMLLLVGEDTILTRFCVLFGPVRACVFKAMRACYIH